MIEFSARQGDTRNPTVLIVKASAKCWIPSSLISLFSQSSVVNVYFHRNVQSAISVCFFLPSSFEERLRDSLHLDRWFYWIEDEEFSMSSRNDNDERNVWRREKWPCFSSMHCWCIRLLCPDVLHALDLGWNILREATRRIHPCSLNATIGKNCWDKWGRTHLS